MAETRKVQIQFDGRALDTIEVLKASSHRRSVADVVRDALALYDWCRRQVAEGFVIAAVKGDKTREVVLPFELAAPVPASEQRAGH